MASGQVRWQGLNLRLGPLDSVVVFKKGRPHTHLILLCHGFGAPGDDLVGLAGEFAQIADERDICPVMVFPAAPIDLASEGMLGGRAWWRLNMARLMEATMRGSFDEMKNEIPPGIDEARNALVATIEAAQSYFSVADKPFLLGGFSQGAMLAVDTALRGLPQPPQALAIYSGALICEQLWMEKVDQLSATQIFQCHGKQDMILPVDTGIWLSELLQPNAAQFELHLFDGPHTIPMEAIAKTMYLLAANHGT